ncbi:4-hydroxythreonine-4-phosphate dehydrogenase PdxA [Cryomorpha ignava]|uniref:4-hydroxythreonine-4-phosphate dehydrogenase PdxA n=1 Tax=Cryomorpha ignava TaxID=101383 RepID=A0A7K3WUH7_9FLAO|nr:4-hydroxythreonine-4-phosphate dehydrogenase PdxA [Cryomorpha ignava]NEN24552.1 4-hydroxythreonine-4-phosphate dehydrogenase PdxA [Cryomorpha ignava]
MTSTDRIRVGITLGDMNGIGPEVILRTLSDSRLFQNIIPIVYGSNRVMNFYKKELGLDEITFQGAKDADQAVYKKANLISITREELLVEPGKVSVQAGKLAFESLQKAVQDLASNKIDVLVTAPINKKNIQSEDFHFPGHTEYLAKYSNVEDALMLMCSETLRVGVVTGHIPLKDVNTHITKQAVLKKILAIDKTLRTDFSIEKPKIAVLGLNPHAGDDGLLGMEEKDVINPAIHEARDQGILAIGPFPADGFFASSNWKNFDAVLAMYHDQGLIPFKSIAGEYGVNFTAGLPIVRTSPAHGTAYDLAGKGIASEQSFRQALYMACDIYHTRMENRELAANALQPQKKD